VRHFNPPRIDSPFGWLSRDHRKLLSVDGQIAFVSGLCIGRRWVGYPDRGIDPWRDTGIELRGPAIADAEQAFQQSWSNTGPPFPDDELPHRDSIPDAGDVTLRVVASMPNTAGLYRLDHLIAAVARRYLWLTDAYFIGTTTYIQALRAASEDGVDVRLLVPSSTDVPFMSALSRSGYRPLLEAGVRVYEWNGPMLHAKTAVTDARWARVGSTNLNLTSWIGNWELDVAVEDERFAQEMEKMYLDDLQNATEIMLNPRKRIRPAVKRPPRWIGAKGSEGSAGRVAAGAIGVGNAVGAAITNRRLLGPAEARSLASVGVVLAGLATVGVLWPRWISVPIAVICAWVAVALLIRALSLHREANRHAKELEAQAVVARPEQPGSRGT
jgi:cardiolipin synthase